MPAKGRLKDLAKASLFQIYKAGLRAGIQILPAHYYSPAPDPRELRRTEANWRRRSSMVGVDTDADRQLHALREMCEPYRAEYSPNRVYREATAQNMGSGYGFVEAQALHGVLRAFKPGRVIEIGSGVSTSCIRAALDMNRAEGHASHLTAVEPYPAPALRAAPDLDLIESPVQAVPTETFEALGAGDLLFVDSTHVVKPGSDVNYVVLEVLPRLKPGVIVQVHDIYIPYDFQRTLYDTMLHWNESTLYHAFLLHNSHARILFNLSQLHYDRPEALQDLFPGYVPEANDNGLGPSERTGDRHFPASLYIEITEG